VISNLNGTNKVVASAYAEMQKLLGLRGQGDYALAIAA
jgi:hypothetical protein